MNHESSWLVNVLARLYMMISINGTALPFLGWRSHFLGLWLVSILEADLLLQLRKLCLQNGDQVRHSFLPNRILTGRLFMGFQGERGGHPKFAIGSRPVPSAGIGCDGRPAADSVRVAHVHHAKKRLKTRRRFWRICLPQYFFIMQLAKFEPRSKQCSSLHHFREVHPEIPKVDGPVTLKNPAIISDLDPWTLDWESFLPAAVLCTSGSRVFQLLASSPPRGPDLFDENVSHINREVTAIRQSGFAPCFKFHRPGT